jgi:biopolymer transport protein TolQ
MASNPFFDAYIQSDLMGKGIIIALLALSIITWAIIFQKIWQTWQLRDASVSFQKKFISQKQKLLMVEYNGLGSPYLEIYLNMKHNTLEILKKNQHFSGKESESFLSPSDIDFVDAHLQMTIVSQTQKLEKNLFVLNTIVSLAPFLGLLGTVWGILMTFSEMKADSAEMVLGGLSLALATTVLGLINAIPALIGYNYLKNSIRDFHTDMECFSTDVLSTVEMQYRKVS